MAKRRGKQLSVWGLASGLGLLLVGAYLLIKYTSGFGFWFGIILAVGVFTLIVVITRSLFLGKL